MDKRIALAATAILIAAICAVAFVCISGNGDKNTSVDTDQSEIGIDTSSFDENSFSVECEGTDVYSIEKNANGEYTVSITSVPEDGIVHITGELLGNIVVNIGEEDDLELELDGVTITSSINSPISILSADNVTITAKKGCSNYIYDTRSAVDDESDYKSVIYSETDLDIGGKGELTVISYHNNGIHTKDDMSVKNLTLSVTCCDNALKANDTMEILSGDITLIATAGDGIKIKNSDTKYNDDGTVKKQNGIVTISSEKGELVLNIYAAYDGIDAAYDVIIQESADNKLTLNILTERYSEYSDIEFESEPEATPGEEEQQPVVPGDVPTKPDQDGKVDPNNRQGDDQGGFNPGEFNPSEFTPGDTKPEDLDFDDVPAKPEEQSENTSPDFNPGDGMNPIVNPFEDVDKAESSYSAKGIKAANSISIYGGTITIKSYDDCIHANKDTEVESDLSETGYGAGTIDIFGGNLTLSTDDDAIHGDAYVKVYDGTITVVTCYEGLEGEFVTVAGGHVSIYATDDGLNSTGGTGEGITVSGGYLYVFAEGDALDSNSRDSYDGALFSGGETVLISSSSVDTSIDAEMGYKYTGGKVVSICMPGGFSYNSYKCSDFSDIGSKATKSLSKNSYLQISDGGKLLVTVKSPLTINNAMIVYLGSNSASFEVSSSSSADLNSDGVCWED